ncbi:MAG TPA: serine hydrolase domain-containing protein [Clostridia bacterium]|nr:serine hydrolase domain-containing protein [Clostridia bacterium]
MKTLALLSWLFCAAWASAATIVPTPDFAAMDQYLNDCLQRNRVPGIAIALIEGDKIVYFKGYGIADSSKRPVTPQTPFLLGSTSKSFTALAVLQLVEQGKLDLDVPVRKYLPWFSMRDGAGGKNASDRITLRQLLHHASGIPNPTGETALVRDDRTVDALERLARSPGSGMEYANANYQIAGLIVQTVSGMSLEDYISAHIFQPLEMKHSHTLPEAARRDGAATGNRYWFFHPIPFPQQPYPRGCFPSGFVSSSAEDLGHWLIAHMNNGLYQGTAVLSSNGMATLHRPHMADYAMGWVVHPEVLEHGGHMPCFGSTLYIDKAHRRGVAVLFNAALAVISAWLIWSLSRTGRWSRPPASDAQFWCFLIVPFVLELAAAWALYAAIPAKFSIAVLHAPDLMMLVGISVMLLVGWGIIRCVWLLVRRLCPRHDQGKRTGRDERGQAGPCART